jgi:hypothetical protein
MALLLSEDVTKVRKSIRDILLDSRAYPTKKAPEVSSSQAQQVLAQVSTLLAGLNSGQAATRWAKKACYYCVGKTAKLETDAVMGFFENGRTLLSEWRAVHKKRYPGDKHNIPDPWLFCVERVNKTISDTCNQAALMQTLVGEKIKQMIIERLGDEWDNMSEEDQQRATAVEKSGCLHHLRNLVMQWGQNLRLCD